MHYDSITKLNLLLPTILICSISLIALAQDAALVVKVIDGNTLELANGEKVRLIGIGTSKDAYDFTKSRTEGKEVRLKFDTQERDEDGKLLAYVYVRTRFNKEIGDFDDDYYKEIFLNAEIVKKGYASPVTTSANTKYTDLFQKLNQQAKENKRGLWK